LNVIYLRKYKKSAVLSGKALFIVKGKDILFLHPLHVPDQLIFNIILIFKKLKSSTKSAEGGQLAVFSTFLNLA
jgi:hypothetical protein